MADELRFLPLLGLPDFASGDDLGASLVEAAGRIGGFREGDIVVVAHKVVSKCEGALVDLRGVTPSRRARSIAGRRDPRLVQVILDQARAIVRRRGSFLITETHHGFVCAASGVDASNAPDDDTVVLLPTDPDASAQRLRSAVAESTGARVGVIISDSFGRAWRRGSVDVAIGAAGVRTVADLRGEGDDRGRPLTMTFIAIADEIAGAAELVMGKARRVPAVVVRGADAFIGEDRASTLVRSRDSDLFR
jgi:coenzyme F420-0:L-glutamate ligase/coenzyme F420-1:gamma-L-glutamate ligase